MRLGRPLRLRLLEGLLALHLCCATASVSIASGGFARGRSLAKAVAQAAQKKTLVLVKVSAAWCAPCRRLAAALASPTSQKRLRPFIRLAYDAELGEGIRVAKRYNVITYPTVLVIDGEGRERGRVSRVDRARAFFAKLDAIVDGSATASALAKRLALHPDDAALRLRLGRLWALRGDRVEAERQLDRVVAQDPNNAQHLAARALLIKGRFLLLRSLGDHRAAVITLEKLRRRFGSSDAAGAAVFPLARALHRSGQTRRAKTLLLRWAKGRAERLRAAAFFCVAEEAAIAWGVAQAKRAIRTAPEVAASYEALARLQQIAGHPRAARKTWKQALRRDPKNPYYRRQAGGDDKKKGSDRE